jgi:heat shock protein HslJ
MRKNILTVCIIATSVIFCACHSTKTAPSAVSSGNAEKSITGKYWKLVEIHGKPVTGENCPHLNVRAEGNRIDGNGGCNDFTGSYEMNGLGRIRFSGMVATQKACFNATTEDEFFGIFDMVDNYSLSRNGDTLSLNRARMAPLARFRAEYLH